MRDLIRILKDVEDLFQVKRNGKIILGCYDGRKEKIVGDFEKVNIGVEGYMRLVDSIRLERVFNMKLKDDRREYKILYQRVILKIKIFFLI